MTTIEKRMSMIGMIAWFIAALFFLYEFFLRTFVGTIAEQLIADLHLSVKQFTLVGSAYYLAYALMQIPVGILADKFGVKKIIIFATLVCALATVLFAHAHSFLAAAAGRFFMGFGSAFAFVSLLVIAANWFPRRLFGFFAGASQFIGTMGPVLAGGPLIAWLHAAHLGWRSALSTVGAFGIVLALLTLVFVKNKPRGGEATVLFLSKTSSLSSRLRRLLKTRQVWVVAIYSASVYVALAVMAAVWGTNYLQSLGLTQDFAAYMISLAWIAYAIGCPLLGYLSDRLHRRKPFLVACAVLGLVSTLLIVYVPLPAKWCYGVLFFLLGFAATGQNVGFAAIAEHSSPSVKATALGLNNGMITLAAAIVPILAGVLITQFNHAAIAQSISPHAFVIGLSLLPAMYLIAVIVSLCFFRETFCKTQQGLIILRR